MLGAALVHLFTATGALLGLWSVYCLFMGDIYLAILLNMSTFIVDGIDGPCARRLRVKEKIPWFNGSAIDGVIDFFNYAMWPAIFLLITSTGSLSHLAACAIVLSSIYWYGCDDQKADDWSFKRFPCLWNIVIFYLFLARADEATTLGLISFFSILSFVPFYFPHSFRLDKVVSSWWARLFLIVLVSTSVISCFLYVLLYPRLPDLMWQYSLLYCGIYLYLTAMLTFRAYKKKAQELSIEDGR